MKTKRNWGIFMNYKELLKKYIQHVGQCDGCDYLHYKFTPEIFTESEWIELDRIASEDIIQPKFKDGDLG